MLLLYIRCLRKLGNMKPDEEGLAALLPLQPRNETIVLSS